MEVKLNEPSQNCQLIHCNHIDYEELQEQVANFPNLLIEKEQEITKKIIQELDLQENSSLAEVIDHLKNRLVNFWENCDKKTKPEIMDLLLLKFGTPKNELDNNCLDAILGKITYFYSETKDCRSKSLSSLIGKVREITQTQFKEGKRKGQNYYSIRLFDKTILKAKKEDLPIEKWTQVEQLAILDQSLLFRYRFSIFGKDICDFQPVGSEPISQNQPKNERGQGTPDPDGKTKSIR